MRTLDELQAQQGYVVIAWFGYLKAGDIIPEGRYRDTHGNFGDVALMVIGVTDFGEWERQNDGEWERQNDADGIAPLDNLDLLYHYAGWSFYRVVPSALHGAYLQA